MNKLTSASLALVFLISLLGGCGSKESLKQYETVSDLNKTIIKSLNCSTNYIDCLNKIRTDDLSEFNAAIDECINKINNCPET